MVVGNLTALPNDIIDQLTVLTRFFQAIGGLIVAYIIFGVLNVIWNRRKSHELVKIRKVVEQINRKLSKK